MQIDFLGLDKEIVIPSPAKYEELLEAHYVIPSHDKRKGNHQKRDRCAI